MQRMPTPVTEAMVDELTEHVDQEIAEDIVTRVIANPQLLLASTESREDIDATVEHVDEHLARFEMEETGLDEDEWRSIRRDVCERLRAELLERFLEESVPTLESEPELRVALRQTTLVDEHVEDIVVEMYDGIVHTDDARVPIAEFQANNQGFAAPRFDTEPDTKVSDEATNDDDRTATQRVLGEATRPSRCPQCGTKPALNRDFCPSCGHRLPEETARDTEESATDNSDHDTADEDGRE